MEGIGSEGRRKGKEGGKMGIVRMKRKKREGEMNKRHLGGKIRDYTGKDNKT